MGGNFTQTEAEASASYSFNISPNATGLVVGDITIADKKGWDFISPTFKTKEFDNGTEKHTVKVLKCIEIIRPREWKNYRSAFGWG
jgi:hypothetical protein